jgi:hypothetical protein
MSERTPFWKVYRLRFIDFLLAHYGTINREQLVDYFGISVPQASMDISDYIAVAPENMVYDKSAKVYRRTDGFRRTYE